MMGERQTELLIVGGGLGGVAAALAALRLGRRVILTEETDWLGGQLTTQAVPLDEYPLLESRGCTASYRQLRNGIRDYYRRNYPLTEQAQANPHLNVGMGRVGLICHEPRVAVAVLEELLAPYRPDLQLEVLLKHKPIAVEMQGDRVRSVKFFQLESGENLEIQANYILDATEFGDLLELGGVEHVIGSESQNTTSEPHALDGPAQPLDQQAATWCFAMDFRAGESHTIEQPEQYTFWRSYRAAFEPAPHFNWLIRHYKTKQPYNKPLFSVPSDHEQADDYWHYRRIFYRQNYPTGRYSSDITLVNWVQNDYWLGPLLGVSPEERQKHLEGAKQLSLSLLYWLQTEAPRHDGGVGYPELRLRPDIVGNTDGLAKHIYVRESRRIQAEFTVLEQHIGVEARAGQIEAEKFFDTIGVGCYRIDLHPSTGLRDTIDLSSYPFQIPLGALLPIRIENLVPACKNIGTTHITNGCYRLHPVEWNIGEAAGALAAYSLNQKLTPRQVRNTPRHLVDFQQLLTNKLGFELEWPQEIRQTAF